MNNPSNLPPGVTDAMIEDAQDEHCEDCGAVLEFDEACGVCDECNALRYDPHEDDAHNDPRTGQAAAINAANKRSR